MQTNQKWKTQPYGSCNPNLTKWETVPSIPHFCKEKYVTFFSSDLADSH